MFGPLESGFEGSQFVAKGYQEFAFRVFAPRRFMEAAWLTQKWFLSLTRHGPTLPNGNPDVKGE
jgi:hypothetical protein